MHLAVMVTFDVLIAYTTMLIMLVALFKNDRK